MTNKLAERLKSRVEVVGSGCWEWRGCKTNGGYGRLSVNRRLVLAHRMSYEVFKGPIGPGLNVLHRCDNPCCINPDHLLTGTQSDNMRDMQAKGRSYYPKGSESARAKLTEAGVSEIREVYAKGGVSMKALGKRYGISPQSVCNIVNHISWVHV